MDLEFKTEKQRREHPKACLIPGLLLSSVFNSRLSGFELSLMGASLDVINPDYINAQLALYYPFNTTRKLRCWLCIILSHPSISIADFIGKGTAFGFSTAELFASAALIGRRDLLDRFLPEKLDDVIELIKADYFGAFRWAVANGKSDVADWLVTGLPESMVRDMVEARGYWALRAAIQGGHTNIVKRLFALVPSRAQAMLSCYNFSPFSWAAAGGYLPIMQELLLRASDDEALKMRAVNDFGSFRSAVQLEYAPIINWLLLFPDVFFYADENREKYRALIRPFITQRLLAMRAIKIENDTADPPVIFDLSNSEAKCSYYILRNLVRRNDPSLLEDISFLTKIPAVRALLDQEIITGQPNAILQTANIYNNKAAAEILLAIPSVSRLAVEHDYYRADSRGQLDLAVLASTIAAGGETHEHEISGTGRGLTIVITATDDGGSLELDSASDGDNLESDSVSSVGFFSVSPSRRGGPVEDKPVTVLHSNQSN